MRVLALFTAGMCGAVLYAMAGLPYGIVVPVCFLAAAVVLLLVRRPISVRVGLVLFGVFAGLLLCRLYVQQEVEWANEYDGRVLTLTMEATAYSSNTDYGTATAVRGMLDGHTFTAILYGDHALQLKPGDQVQGIAKLQSTDSYWGEDDLYYGTRGMDFILKLSKQYQVETCASIPIQYIPRWISHTLQQQLAKLLPSKEWGYAVALLSGDRGGLSDTFEMHLSQSGTKHIVAVSGMHIGILLGAIMLIFGQYGWKTSVLGLPLIWLFALSVGMTASVVRSAIMFSFVLIAPLLGRESDTPTTVLLALALLIIPNPRAIWDVGLQLSFASVTGILLFSGRCFQQLWSLRIIQWLSSRHRICKQVLRVICAGVGSSVAVIPLTLPLSLLYFDTFSMAGLLSGAVIVPLIPACFILSLVAALVSLVSLPVALVLAKPLQILIGGTMGLTEWAARLPFAMFTMDNGYTWIFLSLFYSIMLIHLCSKQTIRLWIPAAAIGCSFMGCVVLSSLEYDRAQLSITMLDVGQGQCIYAESKGISALYDCGGEDRPAARAISLLQSSGRFRLHALVVSHYDTDHAGGVPELLRTIKVDTLYLPSTDDEGNMQELILEAAAETDTQVWWVDQDLTLSFGAATLSIYAPVSSEDGNNGSLSAHWRSGPFDVLATGDMDADAESALMKRQGLSGIEVLVSGHHGAATSTGEKLLEQLTPEIVLISVGAENSYGHPAAQTLRRLLEISADVYRTDQCGNITIRR